MNSRVYPKEPLNARLSPDEVRRYSRHLILPEFGARGQKHLKASRVLIVGAGGLGSPAAMYLAAAGVGTLGLIDFDVVDLSNLQRQLLHSTADVGRLKVESAKDRLSALNPTITLQTHAEPLTRDNALALFRGYDVILDGTDTFATRYLINDACLLTGKPNVSGSVFRFEGQLSTFCVKGGPCYRCLYPEPPPPGLVPACGEGGVLGVVPGLVGTLQAAEAIKVLTGLGDSLVGRLLAVDVLGMSMREYKVPRNPSCEACGDHPTITELIDYDVMCDVAPPKVPEVTADWLRERLGTVTLLDVRETGERDISDIEGSISIPYGELGERANTLPTDKELVVFCRVGTRSARAVQLLIDRGFRRVFNLAGGLEQWDD